MKLSELKDKKILIVGQGKEGQSAYTFLKGALPNSSIEITDQSQGEHYLDKQKDFDIAIKSPGVPAEKITIPYTTPTNIFFANIHNMVIGVTGTKGKSTTSSLIYAILKEAGKKVHLVGNIGNPMLEEIQQPFESDDIFVCELSSYQLSDINYSPHISVILNLFPEHMNYHGSVENYYEAKHTILANAKSNDYFVFNPDYPLLKEWSEKASCQSVAFVKSIPFTFSTKLQGNHNILNIKAAVTVGHILKIPTHVIQVALEKFQPLPHRLELVGEYKRIQFYDDAISTTPESTIAALHSLKNISTLFLGGQNRGYDFTKLAEEVAKHHISNIVLFPDSGEDIKKELKKQGQFNMIETSSMDEAVQFAFDHSTPDSVCLLSTASPSYTLWKNFEEKGDEFQRYVRHYGKTTTS